MLSLNGAREATVFQYNLRSLMFLMLAFALLSWVLFAIPGVAAVVILAAVYVVLPGMAITGVVYFRRYGRAFCIATLPALAVVPFFLMILADGPFWYRLLGDDEMANAKLTMLGGYVLIAVAGAGGLLIRYLAEPREPDRTVIAKPASLAEAYHREDARRLQ